MLVLVGLDHVGLADVLLSNGLTLADVVHDRAEAIANEVRTGRGATVVVDDLITGRRAPRVTSAVTVKDVRARAWQARDGLLTRAAAKHGLQVRAK